MSKRTNEILMLAKQQKVKGIPITRHTIEQSDTSSLLNSSEKSYTVNEHWRNERSEYISVENKSCLRDSLENGKVATNNAFTKKNKMISEWLSSIANKEEYIGDNRKTSHFVSAVDGSVCCLQKEKNISTDILKNSEPNDTSELFKEQFSPINVEEKYPVNVLKNALLDPESSESVLLANSTTGNFVKTFPPVNLVQERALEDHFKRDIIKEDANNISLELDCSRDIVSSVKVNILSDILLVNDSSIVSEKIGTSSTSEKTISLKVQEKPVNFKKDFIKEYTNNLPSPNRCSPSNVLNTGKVSENSAVLSVYHSNVSLGNFDGLITGNFIVDPEGYLSNISIPTEFFGNGNDQPEVMYTTENCDGNKSDLPDFISPTNSSSISWQSNGCLDEHLFSSSDNEGSTNNSKEDSPEISKACSIIYQKTSPDLSTEAQIIEKEVESTERKNYKDKKDLCIFCEKDVSHFARHMSTWHSDEIEVQRILSLKISKEKKQAWGILRKKGNFIHNRSNTILRPVKRAERNKYVSAEQLLPCSHCLGFYRKKSLFRHTKRCSENPDFGKKGKRQASQSNGQTALLLASTIKHDELLKKELFPRMRADEVTLIVKKDFLICNYGYSYLKGRRNKGNLDLVRQNVRRLAKLLKFARKETNDIKELIDVLRPCYFHIIVKGVNEIARYNPETDFYESPTLAMNFGTLIKKCCDLAYLHLLQKPNTNDQRKDLKILKTLIESQWSNEISAQAAANLNLKKWNKDELLPLTSDLKKLNDFLKTRAENEYTQLQLNDKNALAYNALKEVIYCQIILLNRRRPAEVAQLKVQTFKSVNLDYQGDNEFEHCLTETEKILIKSYSRVVIRGKRGRGVPILLSPNMRKHFDYLVEVRNNFVVDNDYIFHTSGKTFIDGTKVLYKYAEKCGIERPHSISATRLRKHLATVTQLLQFSDKDLEQLSKFMGHTLKTHCNVYRLSDNMYQTAKVSKLLLLMTEGGVAQFQGKNLDDIDIDLNPISEEFDILESMRPTSRNECNQPDEDICPILKQQRPENSTVTALHTEILPSISKTNADKPSKRIIPDKRVSWTNFQKKIVASHFADHIKKKLSPKRVEVEKLMIEYHELFKDKKWTSIKIMVCNMYNGKLKQPVS